MMLTNHTFNNPYKDITLLRYPQEENRNFRAWDAADELVLHTLQERSLINEATALATAADAFGAMSIPLQDTNPVHISNSVLSQIAYRQNAKANGIAPSMLTMVSILNIPHRSFDLVLLKMPKSLSMLEHWLHCLKPTLTPHSKIITGVMAKYLRSSMLDTLEKWIGTTTSSRAVKKARVIISCNDQTLTPNYEPTVKLNIPGLNWSLENQKGIFADDKLDVGTRFMLENMHKIFKDENGRIADLACGNGILGIHFKHLSPKADMVFSDESFLAVESARLNYYQHFPDSQAEFSVCDGLIDVTGQVDGVLCNPPFHSHHAVNETMAIRLFKQAQQRLSARGWLCVVANKHLHYSKPLQRLFNDVQTIASNHKFNIFYCRKPRQ